MEFYEAAIFIFVVVQAMSSLFIKPKKNRVFFCLSLAALLGALVVTAINGIKVTMVFVLLAAVLYIIDDILHLLNTDKLRLLDKKVSSILVIIFSTLSLVSTLWLMPTFKLLPASGQFSVGKVTTILTDTSRSDPYDGSKSRKVIVDLYYPTDSTKGYSPAVYFDGESMARSFRLPSFVGSYLKNVKSHSYIDAPIVENKGCFPLVVFSHGMGSAPQAYMSIIQELASNGFVVASINHTDYSMFSTINGALIPFKANDVDQAMGSLDKGNSELIKTALTVWSSDVRFVISEIVGGKIDSSITDRIDKNSIAVMGHSFGGSTAADVLFRDPHIKAGIDLDGPIYGDALNGISQPFMFIISDREGIDYDKIEHAGGDAQKVKGIIEHFFGSVSSLKKNSTGAIYTVTIKGSSHSSFTDMLLYAPFKYLDSNPAQINPVKAVTITNEYIIGFLNEKLKLENNQLKVIEPDSAVRIDF